MRVLLGLDAYNPLGFLAALGLLRVLNDEAERTGQTYDSLVRAMLAPA